MANIAGSYDENAEPNQFDRLPAFADQRAKIIGSEIEDIKDNKGRCLNLTWQIETGPMDGRLFWQRLNLWFTGPEKKPGEVVRIANAQFAAIRTATGKVAPQNSEELHHIPCLVSYGPQKNDPNYDEVKSVKPIAAAPGGPAPVQQQRQAPAATQRQALPASNSSGGSAPWRKSA